MAYADKLKDPRWQKKRLEVMQRDGFKCRDCGSITNTLHVHHCGYRGKEPWDTPVELLLTLCDSCHRTRQSIEKEAKWTIEEWLVKSHVDDIPSIHVTTSAEYEWDASLRWFLHAIENPECRKFYEDVTGTSPKWKSVDCNLMA